MDRRTKYPHRGYFLCGGLYMVRPGYECLYAGIADLVHRVHLGRFYIQKQSLSSFLGKSLIPVAVSFSVNNRTIELSLPVYPSSAISISSNPYKLTYLVCTVATNTLARIHFFYVDKRKSSKPRPHYSFSS